MIISERRIAANRRNAQLSCGPKSTAGKSISSRNAIRHGLLSNLRVLPFVETQSDWLAHYWQTTEALQPVGCIEFALAERIALMLWRLNRAARQEREWAAIALEEADQHAAIRRHSENRDGDADPREAVRRTDRLLAIVRRFQAARDEETLLTTDVYDLIDAAIRIGGARLAGVERSALIPECGGFDVDGAMPWTVERVRSIWNAVARRTGRTLEAVVSDTLNELLAAQLRLQADAQTAERRAQRRRRQRLLPTSEKLDRISRYESALERSLYRALHELRQIRAIRSGANHRSHPVAVSVVVAGREVVTNPCVPGAKVADAFGYQSDGIDEN